jgi:hypothetical protein
MGATTKTYVAALMVMHGYNQTTFAEETIGSSTSPETLRFMQPYMTLSYALNEFELSSAKPKT